MLTSRLLRKLLCYEVGLFPLDRRLGSEKTIYLTFDDGPNPIHSNKVMDILAKYDIKATFFVIGAHVEKEMDTAKRMVREGHLLGNHTNTHRILPNVSKEERILEIETCQKIIDMLQHSNNKLFRPPQGLVTISDILYLRLKNYRTLLWSIDSNDHLLVGDFDSHLRHLAKSQNIVLFHDDNGACIEPLTTLLPIWIDQGFRFASPYHGM